MSLSSRSLPMYLYALTKFTGSLEDVNINQDCFIYQNELENMKVYILVDMEGISGIVRSEQVSGVGNEYEEARKFLTGDINAAVEGALEGGATEIIVNDLHGARGGCNLLPERLHPEARYIWGHNRRRLALIEQKFAVRS